MKDGGRAIHNWEKKLWEVKTAHSPWVFQIINKMMPCEENYIGWDTDSYAQIWRICFLNILYFFLHESHTKCMQFDSPHSTACKMFMRFFFILMKARIHFDRTERLAKKWLSKFGLFHWCIYFVKTVSFYLPELSLLTHIIITCHFLLLL